MRTSNTSVRQATKNLGLSALILLVAACSGQSSGHKAESLIAPAIGETPVGSGGESGGGSGTETGSGSGSGSGTETGSGTGSEPGSTRPGDSPSGISGGDSSQVKMAPIDVNRYPVESVVCDPFGNGGDVRSNAGLKAELFYVQGNQNFTSVQQYIDQGHKSSQNIFLSQLFVPTRRFEQGFANEAGEAMKDDNGNLLYEWFAMRFRSVLRLGPNEEEGLYQLAALSDDGSVVKLRDSNGQWKTVVNNDGDHATRLACASDAIEFKRGSEHLMELDYYQGPRYNIALTLMKRKVAPGFTQDPLCGKSGISLYFDPNKDSAPQQGYLDLLSRGWEPLSRDNFGIEAGDQYNPCLNAQGPEIIDFHVAELSRYYVILTWKTDVPATSQLVVVDPLTGKSKTTTSDNILRTTHQIVLDVDPDYLYEVKAVSVGENLGRTISEPLHIRSAGANL